MARSVKKIETTVIDLASLRQDQVAWLIGKSPAWVRARAHIFERDGRGLYNGRQSIEAFIGTLPKSAPIDPDLLCLF